MKVLIAVASLHQGTSEIAEALADELRSQGIQVESVGVERIADVRGYDAAIIGSAIYERSWLGSALNLIANHAEKLSQIPVWLFSSGHIAGLPVDAEPKQLAELMQQTKAIEHKVFAGRLEKERLNFAERLIARILHAPVGDYRDWGAIRSWAQEIAKRLHQTSGAKE
jgi:menaquinone-dependent protoporphyrinogen oxidase